MHYFETCAINYEELCSELPDKMYLYIYEIHSILLMTSCFVFRIVLVFVQTR